MRSRLWALVVGVALLRASAAHSAGQVAWVQGYPKPGPKPGQVLIKAKAVADAGHKLHSAVVEYGRNGDVFETKRLKLKADGTVEETALANLVPGTPYVVLLKVRQKPDGEEEPSELALVAEVRASPKKK